MLQPTDPEGAFNILPTLAIPYLGWEFGVILWSQQSEISDVARLLRAFIASIAAGVIGGFIDLWIPLNRTIWSLSFITEVVAIGGMIACFWYSLLEVKELPFLPEKACKIIHQAVKPLCWLGANSLLVYVLFSVWTSVGQDVIHVTRAGDDTSLWMWIYWELFAVWIESKTFASLFVAILYSVIAILLTYPLYRMKLSIRL